MTNPDSPINPVGSSVYANSQGLTKREYFAAMAMQGLLADGHYFNKFIAETSRRMADVLIEELNKTNKTHPL